MPPINGKFFRPLENRLTRINDSYQGYLEISRNGIISIGIEFTSKFLPDHVYIKYSTRFYFHHSIVNEVFDYVNTISFKGMKEIIVKNFAVKNEDGEDWNFIRYEGMLAHTEVANEIKRIQAANKKEESF